MAFTYKVIHYVNLFLRVLIEYTVGWRLWQAFQKHPGLTFLAPIEINGNIPIDFSGSRVRPTLSPFENPTLHQSSLKDTNLRSSISDSFFHTFWVEILEKYI